MKLTCDERFSIEEPLHPHARVSHRCQLALELGRGHLRHVGLISHLRHEPWGLVSFSIKYIVLGHDHLGGVLLHGLLHVDHAHGGLACRIFLFRLLFTHNIQPRGALHRPALVCDDALVHTGVPLERPVDVEDDEAEVVESVSPGPDLDRLCFISDISHHYATWIGRPS